MTPNPLDEIEARLTAAEAGGYRSFPWRPIINTAGDRHGVVDGDGCIVTTGDKAVAELLAHAPADIAKLVKALRRIEASINYWETLSDGDRHYAGVIRKHITEALGS